MNIEIRTQHLDLADALQGYVKRRLRFCLSRFRPRLGLITVRLSDINGPRGGVDKCCRIIAEVVPSGSVVLEETDADLYAAIDRAVDRVGRSLTRHLKWTRELGTERESIRKEGNLRRRPYLRQR